MLQNPVYRISILLLTALALATQLNPIRQTLLDKMACRYREGESEHFCECIGKELETNITYTAGLSQGPLDNATICIGIPTDRFSIAYK